MYLLSFSILLLWVFENIQLPAQQREGIWGLAFLIMLQISEDLSPRGGLKGSVWQNLCGYRITVWALHTRGAPLPWTHWAVKCSFWSIRRGVLSAELLSFWAELGRGGLFPQFFLPNICWVIFQKWFDLFWLLCGKRRALFPGIVGLKLICNLQPSWFSQKWGSTTRWEWCWRWRLRFCRGVLLYCSRFTWLLQAPVDCSKTGNIPVPHPSRFWIKQKDLLSLSAAWYLV